MAHDPFNAIIAPRPIGWISTKSKTGVLNLAPYSFFNALNYTPPIIGFSVVGSKKDSLVNVQETGEFCWNLVSEDLIDAMNSRMLRSFVHKVVVAGNRFELEHLTDVM